MKRMREEEGEGEGEGGDDRKEEEGGGEFDGPASRIRRLSRECKVAAETRIVGSIVRDTNNKKANRSERVQIRPFVNRSSSSSRKQKQKQESVENDDDDDVGNDDDFITEYGFTQQDILELESNVNKNNNNHAGGDVKSSFLVGNGGFNRFGGGSGRRPRDVCLMGGCLCGDIRYVTFSFPREVVNCYCQMCRRAGGALYQTYCCFPSNHVSFSFDNHHLNNHLPNKDVSTGSKDKDIEHPGEIVVFRSSSVARRGHCSRCSASIWLQYDPEWDTESLVWLSVGTLDRPEKVHPTLHWCLEDKIPWLALSSPELPKANWAGKLYDSDDEECRSRDNNDSNHNNENPTGGTIQNENSHLREFSDLSKQSSF